MKRFLSLLISFSLLLCLMGCSSAEPNGVAFYYSKKSDQFDYFEEDGVIRSEQRDLIGHRDDLRYMVGLYLAGPMDETLSMPFPKTTRLISVEKNNGIITITLSGHANILTDSEFALGCACLTITCMEFTDCKAVTVVSDERSITLDQSKILLYDSLPQQENTGG